MQAKTFDLTLLNGVNGFTIPGIVANGLLGVSVSNAGDINGDGIADLVLGADGANSNNGISYVIFGKSAPFSPSFNLTNLNGSNGFSIIPGVAGNGWLGHSVSSAGDINGDTITDLVLGAIYGNSVGGDSYVLFGSRSSFPAVFNLTNLNGSNGFTISGIVHGYLGASVNTAGDINADGIADLVLGAPAANYSTNGTVYVIFGNRGGFGSTFNLAALNGSNGFTVPGVVSFGELGTSVSMAGDVNGDGIADLLLGAPLANSLNGMAYVIFGNRGGFGSVFNLATLNGNNGFTIPSITLGGQLGISVSTAGDIGPVVR